METQNLAKATVLRMIERLWNGHELALADELFPAEFDNGPDQPRGPDGIKAWHRSTRASFPDLRYTLDEIVAEGTRVAVRWTATGTQQGQFGPIPPTGKQATYAGVHFVTVEAGRIVALWAINDTFGKVLQLGVEIVPPPSP